MNWKIWFFAYVITYVVIPNSVSSSFAKPPDKGFAAQLLYITSPLSPSYAPNRTTHEINKHSIAISTAHNYHFANRPFGLESLDPPLSHDFVMRFVFGVPAVQTFAIPDTGTDLIMLHCGSDCPTCIHDKDTPVEDLEEYERRNTVYIPNLSYTHRNVRCDRAICQKFPQGKCSLDGRKYCTFSVHYPDQSNSMGIVGNDLTFVNETELIGKLYFGCVYHNNSYFEVQNLPGVVGLKRSKSGISLTSQIENPSFSYCHTAAQLGGNIKFGSEAVLGQGGSTPLVPNSFGNYHIMLENIRYNGKELLPLNDFFKMEDTSPAETGFIIDIGTTFTMLYAEAYDKLLDAVKHTSPMIGRQVYKSPLWDLCYANITGVPKIEMMFNGFDLTLSDENGWIEGPEGIHCLGIKKTPNRLSVLGMYQQRGVNVGFDLANSQVWFQNQINICPVPDILDWHFF